MKASMKNAESSDSPQYLKIPKVLILEPQKNYYSESKKAIKTEFRYNLSKDSPFYKSSPSEIQYNENFPYDKKSSYNIMKDNQEYKIGEDPTKRSEYFIKKKLPPLEVYK